MRAGEYGLQRMSTAHMDWVQSADEAPVMLNMHCRWEKCTCSLFHAQLPSVALWQSSFQSMVGWWHGICASER